MSLNWQEIALILSELPLKGSSIQKVNQIGFHALVFELYHAEHGRYELFVEIGTPKSRLHMLTREESYERPKKNAKLQRFIQFMRAHVEGSRITSAVQEEGDRLITWELNQHGTVLFLLFRLYSGAGANIIVCDSQMLILDLMFRRPTRNEVSNQTLILEKRTEMVDYSRFVVRERVEGLSFNAQIEHEYRGGGAHEELQRLLDQVNSLKEKELARMQQTIRTLERRLEEASGYDSYKNTADLLGSFVHLVKPKTSWVEVPDYFHDQGSTVVIELDPSLTPGENVEAYYRKFQKGKRGVQNIMEELESVNNEEASVLQKFNMLLTPNQEGKYAVEALKKALGTAPVDARKDPYAGAPGLRFNSGPYTILVGRNAKENDELLRRWTRGNDFWMHTRDVPGGYIFIKAIAKKTIPLETLLDAATLALLYSKAKDSRKADLYYTQVKYLRRVKDGKTGLVIPTQEKNFSIELDDKRVLRLFSTSEHEINEK